MRILGGSASRRSPRTSLFAMRPLPAREGTMAREKTRSNFRAVAKRIIEDHRSFDPPGSAAAGLHSFDGILPDYSGAALSRYTSRARKDLKALDRIAQTDGLSRAARLELGVLRGLLLSELSEIDDQRLPRAFPFYFLYRLSIVNYLLREYAPLDRRLRAVGKLQSQIPGFLRVLRGTIDRRLADTCYEMAEMAAAGILDAYSRELPDHLADASPVVRALVERTNETAKSELKDLVHELTTDYKPRIKREFALGRRKYERMIFAEHLARIPLERLSEVGRADMKANQTAFRETAKQIDSSKAPKEVIEDMERDHQTEENLIEDTSGKIEEIGKYELEDAFVAVAYDRLGK